MKLSDIGLMRLAAQRITTDHLKQPEDVVRHLLAMQAQDYAGALWSIGLRTQASTLSDVEQAIQDRKIVRTWPMRGTLHFLHADDIHWMVKLLAPRVTAMARNRRLALGLSDEVVAEAEAVLREVLKGGNSIVRNKVTELLQAGVKSTDITNQQTQHLMRNFGERGIICFGPHRGKQPTFVLLDEWVTPPAEKPREEALAELARRYFIGHGPASLKDFAGWTMLTLTDARLGLSQIEAELEKAELDGVTYYFAKGLKPIPQKETILLPGFDEYLLGYKERGAVLELEHSNKIVPGGNGMFLPTAIENGRVVGLWRRKVTTKAIISTYDGFYGDVGAAKAEERYKAFLLNKK